MPSPTQERDRATSMASERPGEALGVARNIRDPWFRAQALSSVARFIDEHRRAAIAGEALDAARACEDAYQRSSVAAWPISALIECGHVDAGREALEQALAEARQATPVGSQVEALRNLLDAAWPLGPRMRERVTRTIVELCAQGAHWRVARASVGAVAQLAVEDREAAARIAEGIGDERGRRKALDAIASGGHGAPRSFP